MQVNRLSDITSDLVPSELPPTGSNGQEAAVKYRPSAFSKGMEE